MGRTSWHRNNQPGRLSARGRGSGGGNNYGGSGNGGDRHTAPTPGLEKLVFTTSTNSAAQYVKAKAALITHFGTQQWSNGTDLTKALREKEAPAFTAPSRPAAPQLVKDEKGVASVTNLAVFETAKLTFGLEIEEYKDAKKDYDNKVRHYTENSARAFNIILQHCSKTVSESIKSDANWTAVENDQDAVRLFKLIANTCHKATDGVEGPMALAGLETECFLCAQGATESLISYSSRFSAAVDVSKAHGGNPGYHPLYVARTYANLVRADKRVPTLEEYVKTNASDLDGDYRVTPEIHKELWDNAETIVCNQMQACLFMQNADSTTYSRVLDGLHNTNHFGESDITPKTLAAAVQFLKEYKITPLQQARPIIRQQVSQNTDGVSFPQAGLERDRTDNNVKCFHCLLKHRLVNCPTVTPQEKAEIYRRMTNRTFVMPTPQATTGVGGVANPNVSGGTTAPPTVAILSTEQQVAAHNATASPDDMMPESFADSLSLMGFTLSQVSTTTPAVLCVSPQFRTDGPFRADMLDPKKVWFDTAASHNVFAAASAEFVSDIHATDHVLETSCNAGITSSNTQGVFAGEISMWGIPNGIATLVSYSALERDGWHIKYETGRHPWTCTSPSGQVLVFEIEKSGRCKGMPYIDMKKFNEARDVNKAQTIFGPGLERHRGTPTRENSVALAQTVKQNMEQFTDAQVKKAIAARRIQAMLAYPASATFKNLVSSNSLLNCPVSPADVTNAQTIFGPDLGRLRGMTRRKKPVRVEVEFQKIPNDFYRLHKFVTLVADVMFVNGLAFFTTRSRDIRLITAEHVPHRSAAELSKSLKKVIQIYSAGGYCVRMCLMDKEFDKIKHKVTGVSINTAAPGEHVGEIERAHQDIKNRCRAVLSLLPFDYYHRQIIIHLVKFVVMMINCVPSKLGITQQMSPRELVTQLKLDVATHCRIPFGSYCEASEDPDITNNMDPRTDPCICLGPSGNIQGSLDCLSLLTGRVVVRRTATEMPMPERIIRVVSSWGKVSGSKEYKKIVVVLNRHKQPIAGPEDVIESDLIALDASRVHPDIPSEFPGVEIEADYNGRDDAVQTPPEPSMSDRIRNARRRLQLRNTGVDPEQDSIPLPRSSGSVDDEDNNAPDLVYEEDSSDDESEVDNSEAPIKIEDDSDVEPDDTDDVLHDEETNDGDDNEDDNTNEEDLRQYGRGHRSSNPTTFIRPSFNNKSYDSGTINFAAAGRHYSVKENGTVNLNLNFDDDVQQPGPIEDVDEHILGVLLAQTYSLSQATKLFGKDLSNTAVKKELTQIDLMDTYVPLHSRDLTEKQKQDALNAFLFLTQKRDSSIKARKVAIGSKQRTYDGYSKSDGTSPTVGTDSVIITAGIDAHERRDVMTIDLPCAYLHTLNDEETVMVLRGKLCELLVQVNPKLYRQYVKTTANGQPILYVKLAKALYGLLRSALLFYRKLSKELVEHGFVINPYDPCVATKMIPTSAKTAEIAIKINNNLPNKDKNFVVPSHHQHTVTWHVDDVKSSHIDPLENTKFALHLSKLYNKKGMKKITIHRGPIHDYLGMDFDFSRAHIDGTVSISMIKNLSKIFKDFPEEITNTRTSPATDRLFDIRDDDDKKKDPLQEELAIHFHHTVAQLLFLCMRSRRDVHTAVSFLTTRVREPDRDDWGKLKNVLKYLKGTRHMKLNISIDTMSTIQWYVDASYGTHKDMRGHTGMIMTMGKGAIMSASKKQKLNSKSSTESELIGVDDVISQILWGRNFIQSLGYTVEHNILFQDNQSTILLASNGKLSSSSKTKHIKHRYFFIKDKVDKKEIEIKYKPTEEMLGDINTKPKQGIAFRTMRSGTMNVERDYDDEKERSLTHPALLPKRE